MPSGQVAALIHDNLPILDNVLSHVPKLIPRKDDLVFELEQDGLKDPPEVNALMQASFL